MQMNWGLPTIVLLFALTLTGCKAKPEASRRESPETNGTIEVQARGLRNAKGFVRVLLFDSSDGFPDSPESAVRAVELDPDEESVKTRLKPVPYGDYAVSVLHDENENLKLDKNFFGLPQEGYGVSRNPKPGFGPPAYEDAVFTLDSPERVLRIKLLYLDDMAKERRKEGS